MNIDLVKLHSSWKKPLLPEFSKDYMLNLKSFLLEEKSKKKLIYPNASDFFSALNLTPLNKVKVVVLGQDPYHGPGQAHGLCFSVCPGIKTPPSLVNIYKELKNDLGLEIPSHGFLESWAKQGVLLLNATLSVEAGKAGSHQNKGWEQFTDQVIRSLTEERENRVYVLWGAYAQKKGAHIDALKNLVLKSVHPSPLSAHRGFFGNKHFSKINSYLEKTGQSPIDWSL